MFSFLLGGLASEALAASSSDEATGVTTTANEQASNATESNSGSFLPLDPFHAGLTIGSGVGWFTSRTASTQAIGQMGPTFHFGLNLEAYDLITVAASFGTIFVKDKASFNQRVVDAYGDKSTASSSSNITIWGLSAGLRTPDFCLHADENGKKWLAMSAYARYGLAWVSGSRSIENCKDCDSRPLSLDGGRFVESGVRIGSKRDNTLGVGGILGYRHYFAGASPSGELQVSLEVSFL